MRRVFSFDTYRSQRRSVQILSTALVVALPFFNVLRLDVPTLRFYFFNSVLWIDEFYVLFLVVMLILWVIVIFSMLYGRVWCGWMCPQTVLDELYYWFDRKTRAWLKLPKAGKSGSGPITGRALVQRAIVVAGSAVLSLFIGFNMVAYFVDPYRMVAEAASFALGPVTTWCIAGTAAIILADVLFWREQFCTKACPYGMLQAVITDSKTQIVRYHTERGEECIECKACVRDCMMGIDIRTSPYQTECIHCGDCVDSCARILGRLKEPLPTLITFSWGEKEEPKTTWYRKLGFVDAKRWVVLGLTAAYALVLVMVIQGRQPLSITASGDRSTLYHVADDGRIYNEYTVKISNRGMEGGWFTIRCESPRGPGEGCAVNLDENPVRLESREVRTLKMRIYSGGASLNAGPNQILLTATSDGDPDVRTTADVVFFMPEKDLTESAAPRQEGSL